MRTHARLLVVALVALGVAVSVLPTAAAEQDPSATLPAAPPVLGPGLLDQAAELAPTDRLEVIVTGRSGAGIDELDRLGVPHRRLQALPMAFATPTVLQLRQLTGATAIRSLWPRESYDLFLDESTQMLGADRVERRLDETGEGVAVAVLDTGIDATHPDLPHGEKVLGNYEVAANPFDGSASLFVDLPDTDDDGHGTHVASTIAGADADGAHLNDGVAPGADLYGYSINVATTIDNARSLAAFDDVIAKRRSGVPIVAISNSWGGGAGEYNPDDPLSVAVKAAFDEGISVVFAAGNAGQEGAELDTASRQCTIPWVICVGAITKPGQLVGFSSRGRPPVATTVTQPDGTEYQVAPGNHDRVLGQRLDIGVFRPTVSGPGVNIVAACAQAACGPTGGYQSLSGTSMSTPHVSGVVALMHGARDALDLRAGQVVNILEGTANPVPGWEVWEAGAGAVDAFRAVQAAQGTVPRVRPNLGARARRLGVPVVTTEEGLAPPLGYTTFPAGGSEHVVEVPRGTGRLDLTITWDNPEENLYLYAWQPGADPDGADAGRADQESWGLLGGLGPRIGNYREGSVTFPAPGEWRVRVYGRVNAVTPYTLEAVTRSTRRPGVSVTSVTANGPRVSLAGRHQVPKRSRVGATRSSVPGTALPLAVTGTPVEHFLHGTAAEADKGTDLLVGANAPFFDENAPTAPDPRFQTGGWYGNDAYAGNFLLAYWRGAFQGTIQGDVPVKLWVSSPTQALGGTLTFTLFDGPAGYVGVDDATAIASATVSAAGVGPAPTLVEATFGNVAHTFGPGRDLTLQVSGSFVDVDYFQVWYDSTEMPSSFTLPVLSGGGGGSGPGRPAGLTATSLVAGGARLRWAPVDGATSYLVFRSTSPKRLGTRLRATSATSYTDRRLAPRRVGYYRVVAVAAGGMRGEPSDVVTAQPVAPRRWVEVRASTGPWEPAVTAGNRWTARIQRGNNPGADGRTFTVRARTFEGASVERTVRVPR
jgi:serine protease AprX